MVKIFCLFFFIIKDTNFMKLVKKKKQVYWKIAHFCKYHNLTLKEPLKHF